MHFGSLDFTLTSEGKLSLANYRVTEGNNTDAITESLGDLSIQTPRDCPLAGHQSEDEYDDLYSDSDSDTWSRTSAGPNSEDYYASEELSSEDEAPLLIDPGMLERQLRAFFGPRPSAEDLRSIALSYINVAIQLKGGAPLTSNELAGNIPITYPFSLTNAASLIEQLIAMESPANPVDSEFVGAVESIYDLLEEGGLTLSDYSSVGSAEYSDGSSFPPSRECLMCDGREGTPEGAVRDVNDDGNEVVPPEDEGRQTP